MALHSTTYIIYTRNKISYIARYACYAMSLSHICYSCGYKDKAEVKKEEKTEMHGDGGYYI